MEDEQLTGRGWTGAGLTAPSGHSSPPALARCTSPSFPALPETDRKRNGKKKKNDVSSGDVPGGPVAKT